MCEYLALLKNTGLLAFHRTNNGGVFDPTRRVFRKPSGPGYVAGVADIEAILAPNGRYVAIECKADTRQSEAQKAYQKSVEAVGGRYFVVRSVDDVKKALDGIK